jgi:hypothetical protein
MKRLFIAMALVAVITCSAFAGTISKNGMNQADLFTWMESVNTALTELWAVNATQDDNATYTIPSMNQ